MQRDGVNNIKTVQVLAPAARTADATGEIQRSVHGPAGIVWFLVSVGAEGITLSGTDKIEFKVFHGDATSPTTPVEAKDIITPLDAVAGIQQAPDGDGIVIILDNGAEAPANYRFGYVGDKDFVAVKDERSGTHGSATVTAVSAILGLLGQSPH